MGVSKQNVAFCIIGYNPSLFGKLLERQSLRVVRALLEERLFELRIGNEWVGLLVDFLDFIFFS